MANSSRITPELSALLQAISPAAVRNITASLEGDWSPQQVAIWRRGEGSLDFSAVARCHPIHRPSLELDFDAGWIGVRCFVRHDGENVFDEALAREIIRRVEEG